MVWLMISGTTGRKKSKETNDELYEASEAVTTVGAVAAVAEGEMRSSKAARSCPNVIVSHGSAIGQMISSDHKPLMRSPEPVIRVLCFSRVADE